MDFNGLWGSFSKRAKEVIALEEESDASQQQEQQSQQEQPVQALVFQKGLDVIASSLSKIGDTLGSAIEESLNVLAPEPTNKNTQVQKNEEQQTREISIDNETQLKASRDVAMAMATKVKLLLRELKTVKKNLSSMNERCLQLEEENKRLRESLEKGLRHEEDDMMRKQLEMLVAEKSRLAQENANYARENQFLHEVIEYHQLALKDVSLLDERIEEVAENLHV